MNSYSILSVLGVSVLAAAGLAVGQGAAACKSTTVNNQGGATCCAQSAAAPTCASSVASTHGVVHSAAGAPRAMALARSPSAQQDPTAARAAALEALLAAQEEASEPGEPALAEAFENVPEPPSPPVAPIAPEPQQQRQKHKLHQAYRYKDGRLEALDTVEQEQVEVELEHARAQAEQARSLDMDGVRRDIERAMQDVERVKTTELERARREIERAMREVERVQNQVSQQVQRETERAMREVERQMQGLRAGHSAHQAGQLEFEQLKQLEGGGLRAKIVVPSVPATPRAPAARGGGRSGSAREQELEARIDELESELARVRGQHVAPQPDADCTPERGHALLAPRVRAQVLTPGQFKMLGELEGLGRGVGRVKVIRPGKGGEFFFEIDGGSVRVGGQGSCCEDQDGDQEWADDEDEADDEEDELWEDDADEDDDEDEADEGDDEEGDGESNGAVTWSVPGFGKMPALYSLGQAGYATALPVTTTANTTTPAVTSAPQTEQRLRGLIDSMRSEVDSIRSALSDLRSEVERRKANELR